MKTKFLILCIVLWSNYANCSNYDTINSNVQVFATYVDPASNILYAGGWKQILKFQNNNWSHFSPPPPSGIIYCITKYNNELYIGGDFGVAKFDGTNWIHLSTTLITNVTEFFIYGNELYVFNDYNNPYLTVWNGTTWSQVNPGVSSIGCSGIQTMFIYNGELYANSAMAVVGGAVIIKKAGINWTFPNGLHHNIHISSHCVFNNNLYLTDGLWVDEYNGVTWRRLDFLTMVDGSGGWNYIKKIRSDGNRLFIAGGFDEIYNDSQYLDVNNIFSWCGDDLISPIETGLSNEYFIRDFNFYNNMLYVFEPTGFNGEQAPFSIIDSLDDLPDPLISISNTTICQGQIINISEISNTGFKWLWEIDDSIPIILNTQNISINLINAGFHNIKVTVYNCVGGSSKVFSNLIYVHPTPSTPTIQVVGDTLFSSSLYNNQWFCNGVQLPDTSNFIIFNLTSSTHIQVIVTNQNGCSASSVIVTQIEKYYSDVILEVFPNPSNGFITLQNNNSLIPQDYLLTVKNMQGEEVLARKINFINTYKLDLTGFNNGLYILYLKNEKEQMVKKIDLHK